jgi:hypothetical protein
MLGRRPCNSGKCVVRDAGQDGVDQQVGPLLIPRPGVLRRQEPHPGVEAEPGGFDVVRGRDEPQFGHPVLQRGLTHAPVAAGPGVPLFGGGRIDPQHGAFDRPPQLGQGLLGGAVQDQGLELGRDVGLELPGGVSDQLRLPHRNHPRRQQAQSAGQVIGQRPGGLQPGLRRVGRHPQRAHHGLLAPMLLRPISPIDRRQHELLLGLQPRDPALQIDQPIDALPRRQLRLRQVSNDPVRDLIVVRQLRADSVIPRQHCGQFRIDIFEHSSDRSAPV